ncbi:MAG TPA: hypothetical protein ENN72_03765 [Firmicutes bacterium]|nr:hypothetical protein [Bacillota bacterium]
MTDYNMMKMLLGKILLFITLIVTVLLYIIFSAPIAFGFAVGVLGMLLHWRLLAYQNEQAVQKKKGTGFVYGFVFFRYALLAALLVGAFLADRISGPMALAGLLFSQLYIFVFALIISNRERGKGNE